MAGPLHPDVDRELDALARRFGAPLRIEARIGAGVHDPIRQTDRIGEVCMVVRRPAGMLLLSTKAVYPAGAYRLPTGGIAPGEGVLAALLRETHEETGLDVVARQFLARISYRVEQEPDPAFHTFAFLLDETGGTLGALDETELISGWREVAPAQLPQVASFLEALDGDGVVGSWRDWGGFRAIVHRAVHQALVGGERGA